MRRALLIFLIALGSFLQACAQSGSIFPQLGNQLATPSAFAIDVAANRLYVVNSNAQVLYDWTQGSFQVYDITNPLAPVLVQSLLTESYSGQIYLDTVRKLAFVPNRFSADEGTQFDNLFQFNVDETSANFLSIVTNDQMGLNAYAIDCCYPADRAWISTSEDVMQYVNLADITAAPGGINLNTPLDANSTLSDNGFNHIARRDAQSFLSRENGGILVVNLDEAGVDGANAVDYAITDLSNPRGIAVRGNTLYVVGEGSECNGDDYCGFVMVLNVTDMPPSFDNQFTTQIDKDDILLATIEVGEFPQEILLSQAYAFVTNQQDDTVSVIDLGTNAVVATIGVGVEPDEDDDQPFSLGLYTTLAGVDQYVYVGNVESDTISILNIEDPNNMRLETTFLGP